MEILEKDKMEGDYQKETDLYMALDKGIDDMENGRVVSHDDARMMIQDRLLGKEYL